VIVKLITVEDAKNIYHMRAAIEGYCSAYLAEHSTEKCGREALERIEMLLEACRKNFNYADEMQFHLEIVQYTKNEEFIKQYSRMRTKIDVFWNEISVKQERPMEIYAEHKAILEAMKNGDAEAARKASERHLMISLEKLQQGDLLMPFEERKDEDASRM